MIFLSAKVGFGLTSATEFSISGQNKVYPAFSIIGLTFVSKIILPENWL
jgi:hypothetical protein